MGEVHSVYRKTQALLPVLKAETILWSLFKAMLILRFYFHNDCDMSFSEDLLTVIQIKIRGYYPCHVHPLMKTMSVHLCNCEDFFI